jgi:hypothetical protein
MASSGCCCCVTIGYDQIPAGANFFFGFSGSGESFASCCETTESIIFLKNGIGRIYDCRLVIAGMNAICNTKPDGSRGISVNFSESDWPTIKDYIENGGRLFFHGAYETCLMDRDRANEFMSALGSSLRISNRFNPALPAAYLYDKCGPAEMFPGEAKISHDIDRMWAGTFNTVEGGDASVWVYPDSFMASQICIVGLFGQTSTNPNPGPKAGPVNPSVVRVQRIGKGYIFLCGCGMEETWALGIFFPTIQIRNCQFFNRLTVDIEDADFI